MTRLSPAHLEQIREGLAAGRRPRVVFTDSAGQMAGQVGHVVALTDPALSEEWVVVQFGRDELPFSPADLQLPTRATKRAQPLTAAGSSTMSNGKASSGRASNGKVSNGNVSSATRRNGQPTVAKAPAARSTRDSAVDTESPGPAPAVAARPARPRPPKPPAALAVTVAYADGAWTVAASQGSRTISRAQTIRAAEALRLVAMLDAPAVRDAVEHIIAAERVAAEQRAQRLRTELAEIETRLAELRDTR